jgi:hypothetical protein
MWTIIAALVAGLVGFAAKIGNDIRTEHEARKSIAAALAGELGAYLRLAEPENTAANIKSLAKRSYADRIALLPGLFSNLPAGHPVFDKVADKIGSLSPEAARGVSEAYNIITGMRLHMAHISSADFIAKPDGMQVAWLDRVPDFYLREVAGMRNTVVLLDSISRQNFRDRYGPR